jgi:hypothetical protein
LVLRWYSSGLCLYSAGTALDHNEGKPGKALHQRQTIEAYLKGWAQLEMREATTTKDLYLEIQFGAIW